MQTRGLVFAPSGAWRGGRAALLERLRGYHQPLSGLANASHRRMMLQCTDTPGSGLGSKLSYPDDTLSLERDSEKVPHVYCMRTAPARNIHGMYGTCVCICMHTAYAPRIGRAPIHWAGGQGDRARRCGAARRACRGGGRRPARRHPHARSGEHSPLSHAAQRHGGHRQDGARCGRQVAHGAYPSSRRRGVEMARGAALAAGRLAVAPTV